VLRAVDVLVFVLANAFLLVAARSATALLRPRSLVDAALTFCVSAIAIVDGVVLLVGIAGRLRAGVLLGVVAVCAAVGLVSSARSGAGMWPRLSRPRVGWATIRCHPWEAVLVALAAVALAWQLFVALVLPPYAYDALGYHLTIVGSWLVRGNVSASNLSPCCARFPANAELMFAWPVVLLHSDALVDTVQVAFALLGALAVVGIARSAGLSRAQGAACGALFAMTPVVLTQAPTAFVDVTIASAALAALHFAIRFAVTGQRLLLIPAGLATGFVFGTKGIGPLWGVALMCVVGGILVVRSRRGLLAWRATAVLAGGFLVLCALFGSYWYLRNWADTGNPIYPVRVTVAGVTLFDGPQSLASEVYDTPSHAPAAWPLAVARSWSADIPFWNQGPYNYQQVRGGLGPVWVWLGLPLLVPVGFVLLRERNPAALLVVVTAAVLVVQPFRWWSRFTLVLAAAGAIAVVLGAARAPRRWMATGIRAAALGLGAAGVVLSSYQVNPAGRAKAISAQRVIRLATEPSSDRTIGRLFFPEYRFLDSVASDATVVVDLGADPIRFTSPFFGPRFTRHVVPSGGRLPSGEAWVVTARGRPLEHQLADSHRFTLISDEQGVRVWRSG
jgi:hypothetical protein